jgi:uracil-DNA glycosylase family 4
MEGLQFVGETGKLLHRTMRNVGLNLRRDCTVTNALICRPPDNKITDKKMIDYCRPNLLNTITDVDPTVIILLGGVAIRSLLGHLWKEDVGGSKRWAGFKIPCRKPNVWICPTYHPSFIAREKRDRVLYEAVFERHLAEAAAIAGTRPWDEVPDYASEIEVIYKPDAAAKIIRQMVKKGGNVAFDYETDRLKPDDKEARIVSCSVCWEGRKTIAYPWVGSAIEATKELLRSSLGKIASNLKFEERWTRRQLGFRVKNWKWDTMVQAHTLDSRAGITGLKFQAFVRLGQEDYAYHLSEYLESKDKGGNAPNRIKEIDLKDLLLYNGLDSLLEYKVAMEQSKELGVRL